MTTSTAEEFRALAKELDKRFGMSQGGTGGASMALRAAADQADELTRLRSQVVRLKKELKESEEARYHGRDESPKTERWYTDGQGNYTKDG